MCLLTAPTVKNRISKMQVGGRPAAVLKTVTSPYLLLTDSTVLPSIEISGGLGPEPMFCSFVFGQEMLSARCEAESLKLLGDVVACVADGRSKAVSCA